MDIQTDGQVDRWSDIQIVRYKDGQIDMVKLTDGQNRQMDVETTETGL